MGSRRSAAAILSRFVIGLMSWFWLTAHLILIAAELNVVLSEHLWPRSLTGELTEADRRSLESGLPERV